MNGTWFDRWLKRPVGVLAWAGAILLAGFWAVKNTPLEWTPKVELPSITISANWQGASPRAMERYITAPIERAVQRVPGTAKIESVSLEGSCSITLSVDEDANLGVFVAQVNEQLTLLRNVLPDRVSPRLTKHVPEELEDEQDFMQIQLIGPLSLDELKNLADRRVKPKLLSLGGVSEIDVSGGTGRELLVTLHPDKLSTYGLDANRVSSTIAELFRDQAFGSLRAKGRTVLLMETAEDRLEPVRNVVLSTNPGDGSQIRLSDVATVELGPAPVYSISRIDGQPVVTLDVKRTRGSHLVQTALLVRSTVDELHAELPEGVRIEVILDKSESVREQLADLRWRGGIGVVLVILVLLFMLQSLRATMVVLFSVGVSLAVAMLLLEPFGLTLNLLTIAGLVLVFGLLVDNSVVVVEQLILRRGEGAERESLRTVWLPLVGGTLSTMVVMLPLVYLSGELQDLFLPFGILVSLTLLASLAVAGLVVPVTHRLLPYHPPPPVSRRRLRRWAAIPYRLAARFPKTTVLALVLLLGLPMWMIPHRMTSVDRRDAHPDAPAIRMAALYNSVMDTDFVRDVREWLDPMLGGALYRFNRSVSFGTSWRYQQRPVVSVSMGFPPGHPIVRADSLMWGFEQIALASPAVEQTNVRITEDRASMTVEFKEDALNEAEPYILRERLISRAINIGGIYIGVYGLLPEGYSSGYGGGISTQGLEAVGPNYEDLDRLISAFSRHLFGRSRRVAGVDPNGGTYSRFSQSRQVLKFDWTPEAEARSHASSSQIVGVIRPIFNSGNNAARVDLENNVQIPIRVAVQGAEDVDVEELIYRPIPVSDSLSIRLAGLAEYTVEERPSSIRREDQQYIRRIGIDFRGPSQMANDFIERELAAFATPVGYEIRKQEYSFFTNEVKRAFGWVTISTILLVFLITAAVFESWRLPLIVILSVPMAGIGVTLGFYWTEAPFAEGAFIGTILMIGIAVNDSILLVDRYRQLREMRPHGNPALLIRLAVRERLRPMLTTTLTSVVAMIPMLVFPDDGDFWTGLAVTVVGGLTASTLLAPVVSVAAVGLLRESRRRRSGRRRRFGRRTEAARAPNGGA